VAWAGSYDLGSPVDAERPIDGRRSNPLLTLPTFTNATRHECYRPAPTMVKRVYLPQALNSIKFYFFPSAPAHDQEPAHCYPKRVFNNKDQPVTTRVLEVTARLLAEKLQTNREGQVGSSSECRRATVVPQGDETVFGRLTCRCSYGPSPLKYR
jgi:hypothetical protein